MKRLTILPLLFLLAWPGSGSAQTAEKPAAKIPPAAQLLIRIGPDQFIKRFDKNKDGVLSRDEVPPFLAKNFDKFDKNQDGKLDRKEIDQLRQILVQRFGEDGKKAPPVAKGGKNQPVTDFDALDRNADGRLTRDELKGTLYASRFDEIDTNHDGQIDRHEFEAFLKKQAEKAAK